MNRKGRKEMAIFITGDTHGDFSRLLPAAFHEQRDLTKEDVFIGLSRTLDANRTKNLPNRRHNRLR